MEVKLVVLEGRHKGREIPLPQTIFMIGRGPQCHLRPHCEQVSKLHCAIARWAGRLLVRDLKSANGTFVNGQRIFGEVIVNDGDVLQVGKLKFAFHVNPNSKQPIQVVREGEVKWLIESPDDSEVLDSSQTIIQALPPPGPGPSDGSGNLSAGQYLRDYFRERKRRAAENVIHLE